MCDNEQVLLQFFYNHKKFLPIPGLESQISSYLYTFQARIQGSSIGLGNYFPHEILIKKSI